MDNRMKRPTTSPAAPDIDEDGPPVVRKGLAVILSNGTAVWLGCMVCCMVLMSVSLVRAEFAESGRTQSATF
jgi:hypothetical protein